MLRRRDWLVGGGCFAAASLAEALRPRHRMSLLQGASLAAVVPERAGAWRSKDVSGLVDTGGTSSLMNRLYSNVVQRSYFQSEQDDPIMFLAAYGQNETNDLLLHRPEVCYPAFGYSITQSLDFNINLKGAKPLPARVLIARAPDENVIILYWTRLGEAFPQSGRQQRIDRLRDSMAGFVTDGILCRFSLTSTNVVDASTRMEALANDLILAVRPDYRAVLIGSGRAAALAGITIHS